MRMLLLWLAVFAAPALAADADTVCATLYTYLAGGGRANASANTSYDLAALKAEEAHLKRNPYEDRRAYRLSVMNRAETVRGELSRGRITQGTIDVTAARCNSHFFPELASQQLAFPDDWWADQP